MKSPLARCLTVLIGVHLVTIAGLSGATILNGRVAVDGSGNVYVTGSSLGSGSGLDYATVKYNSSGTPQWVARYNGPANSEDIPYSIAVDASGNVYVTGSSAGSGSGLDYATVKYNSSGTQQWVARYNGPANSTDAAYCLALDGSGNIYVTGTSLGSGTGQDYATIKYNSSGTQQWALRYNGPGGNNDTAYAVAVDGSANVYVTGTSLGAGTSMDYATIKYNSGGMQQWVARYNGPASIDDTAYSISVDSSGNVYVTGSSGGSGTGQDYATIKYNSSGTQQWAARYNGPGGNTDSAYAIAVDASGNVYVTGTSLGSGTGQDYATVKYNSSGSQQWVSRYNGPGGNNDAAYAIAVDGSSNVYITGSSLGSGTGDDYATIKYNSSGAQQWVSRYNGPVSGNDGADSLMIDASANVYVAGGSLGAGSGNDFATVKYTSAGSQSWVSRYNGPANGDDIAKVEGSARSATLLSNLLRGAENSRRRIAGPVSLASRKF
jgi:uncharacterized delta-60 repeat protein